MNFRRVAVLVLFCTGFYQSIAQQALTNRIRLKETTVTVHNNTLEWFNSSSSRLLKGPVQVLVYFNGPVTQTQKNTLRDNGIRLQGYIPDNAYTAVIDKRPTESIIATTNLYGIVDIKPEWKADAVLWTMAGNANEKLQLIVSMADNVSATDISAFIKQLEGNLLHGNLEELNTYKMEIPASKLHELANWYSVLYITMLSGDHDLNIEAKSATRANLVAYSGVGGLGLTGEGVTIGVGDNTSGAFHTDLKDRIINYNPAAYTNHGVHINGIVGGAGIVDTKGEGHAPHSILVDHLYSAVWEQTPAMVQAHNMTITNNSYAAIVGDCKYAGTYDVNSLALDKMSLAHDEVLHVFAAGNDGHLDCPPVPKGYATVNGGYQPAKNNIVVTSTDKAYINAKDGGRGPVKDGRLKPEMTAVGVNVNSTTRDEAYLVAGGTSMACPEVAGALGLVTERYRQLKGNVNPKAVLLKALMLNGTMDIGNPGPDYRFGFGFMDVSRTVDMLNMERYVMNTVETGGTKSIIVNVPPNTAQLKVMLCWHDEPGNPAAANQLVNDLDLEVTEPNATLHKPLILDPAPANILNNAVEGADRKNNSEQVTIYNPQPGSYNINVKGYNVTTATQGYALAYDFVPSGLSISFPYTLSQVMSGDSMHVYWFIADKDNAAAKTFVLEYSTDDGQNWIGINNAIPADLRTYTWFVPDGINSGKCRMRISRNVSNESFTTEKFIINIRQVAALDTVQCPGYIRFHWNPVPNATSYRVHRKVGPYMRDMGATTDTTYTFSGLSTDTFYYVAVSPVIDGHTGYRSLAIKRRPNNGDCKGNISDNDLAIEKMISPVTGRKFTSSELSNSETIQVLVRNFDDVITNYYKFSYSINGSPWQSQVHNTPIPAMGYTILDIPNVNMSAIGTNTIKLAIENLLGTDPVNVNDTIVKVIRQLNNDPIDIATGFIDDFETIPALNIYADSVGISPNDHWDYANNDTGHLRSFVNQGITIAGNRSISMDAAKNLKGGENKNELTGTFNLGNYNANEEEVRMEFDYLLHGIPRFKNGNDVLLRGSDTAEWQTAFYYEATNASIGKVLLSGTISITDILQAAGQNFSSSFQLKFNQRDTTLIAAKDYGTGLTLDNVRFYTVQNDVQLLSIVSPQEKECGITGASPLTVQVRNGVNQAQAGVKIYYKLDDNALVSETLPALAGKQQQLYTFLQKADLSKPGKHTISIWLDAQGDTYRKNDSILNYIVYNQPLITSYPYLEDFEDNDGYWYSEGINSSWEYGVPSSIKINKAASGTKTWKTNLHGNYNNNENSYLYSPCFDISSLTNPAFRFKLATDIENCGMVMCDLALMDYSFDGKTWERLGAPKQGINWYNDSAYIWTEQDKPNWREAMIPLPKGNTIRLRYRFISDPAATFEGIAVDDMEIYNIKSYTENQLISISPNPTSDGRINIEWAAIAKPEMRIVITDIMGRVVYSTTVTGINGYNMSTLQTPHFSSGVYVMKLYISDAKSEHRIVYK